LSGPVRNDEVEPSAIKYWVSSPPDLTNELAVKVFVIVTPRRSIAIHILLGKGKREDEFNANTS
jgi:hypothetical protein